MTKAEQIEVALVVTLPLAIYVCSGALPSSLSLGTLVLAGSVLILLQGLVRDLWLLKSARRQAARMDQATAANPSTQAPCLCVESIVGVVGVAAGLGLAFAGAATRVGMSPWGWALLVFGVMAFGFLVKDVVIGWMPWQIRKEKDHLNVIFSWKRRPESKPGQDRDSR